MFGSVAWGSVKRRARDVLDLMRVTLDVERLVSSLTIAQAQLVAIAKILAMRPRILVLDEPTAALSGGELGTLFDLVDRLRREGVAIIYISHRMDEIFRLGDRVTVLRDGRAVVTEDVAKTAEDQLIQWMVGRRTEQRFPSLPALRSDKIVLSVRNLVTPTLNDVSFDLHEGEIVGCTGLAGCGHDALARVLVGLEPVLGGEILIAGERAGRLSPRASQALGVALVPEDRKGHGLVISASIADNATYSVLDRHTHFGVLDASALTELVRRYHKSLRNPLLDARPARLDPVWRQPAKGRAGARALDRTNAPRFGRADPWHRRGSQGGDLSTHREPDRAGSLGAAHLLGDGGSHGPLSPANRPLGRTSDCDANATLQRRRDSCKGPSDQ